MTLKAELLIAPRARALSFSSYSVGSDLRRDMLALPPADRTSLLGLDTLAGLLTDKLSFCWVCIFLLLI